MSGTFSAEKVPDTFLSGLVELIITDAHAGARLDWFLAQQFPNYSRVHLRRVVNTAGAVKVEGRGAKPSHRLKAGERVSIVLPDPARGGSEAEDIPISVLYEDDLLAVIDKPPGMVVHPARGHWSGTLTAALQFHFDHLSTTGGPTRPGIVHRLDRDTSGVMVVAKNDQTHMQLSEQFEQRVVEKEYFAIVAGVLDKDRDIIDLPIGPHPHHREKMAIRHEHPQSRSAQTFYEVIERFAGYTSVRLLPKTGRTHQIRLHLASIGCAVLCDRLYGGRAQITRGEIRHQPTDATVLLDRQALHARRLKFKHPRTGEFLETVAPLPADLQSMIEELRAATQEVRATAVRRGYRAR